MVYVVFGINSEVVRVGLPLDPIMLEELLASKLPVVMDKVVPMGFPFNPNVTEILVKKTWNEVSVGDNAKVAVPIVLLNGEVSPKMPNALTLK